MSKIPPRHSDGHSPKADEKKDLPPALQLNPDLSSAQKSAAQTPKTPFVPSTSAKPQKEKDSSAQSKESLLPNHTSTDEQADPPTGNNSLRSRDLLVQFFRLVRHLTSQPIQIRKALVLVILTALICSFFVWKWGVEEGRKRLLQEQTKETSQASPEFWAAMDHALQDLHSGKAAAATETFQQLSQQNPGVSSLSYLTALSAIRSGQPAIAQMKADESIAKRERVSDCLALIALLEAQKAYDLSVKKWHFDVLNG